MLPHLASRLFGTPLLVHRAKLDVILGALSDRIGLAAPVAGLDGADLSVKRHLADAADSPGIAVIPVHGSLVKRTLGVEALSGLTSYADIETMLAAAVSDASVRGILLDIDSPGGEVNGCFELARTVREAAALKPVWAIANDSAFSAAYALGCAAQRLFVTETGGVGSIGVIALHVDQSAKDAQDGLHYTAITAGAHKNDYSPHEPLQDAARSALQAEVDRLYGMFSAHVSAMRGLDEQVVRASEAAVYFGPQGVALGLADAVGTLGTALSEFSDFLRARGGKTPTPRTALLSAAQEFTPMSDLQTEQETAAQAAELLAQARREAGQSAQAIAEMCQIAGCPDRAAEFIAAGLTEAQVRTALLEARAQRSAQTEVIGAHAPAAWSAPDADPAHSPVVKAIQKRLGKKE